MKKLIAAGVVLLSVVIAVVLLLAVRQETTGPSVSLPSSNGPATARLSQLPLTEGDAPVIARESQTPALPSAAALVAAQPDEARRLAGQRRDAMLRLMRKNPRKALDRSLTWNEWLALPAELRALVEEPFSQTVEFSMTPDCRPTEARTTRWQSHRVKLNGEWLEAFVYGKRESIPAKTQLPVQGIRLGHQVALWDQAVMSLSGAELAAAQTQLPDGNERTRSWLTGLPIDGVPSAALVGGKIHYFASWDEVDQVAQAVASAEAKLGPNTIAMAMAAALNGGVVFNLPMFAPAAVQAQSEWTETPKRVLIMNVNYSPTSPSDYTPAILASEFLTASNAIREMSYNKTWTVNTVVPTLVTISNPQSFWETNGNEFSIMDAAKAVAVTRGYVLANYDIFVVAMPYMQRWAGAAAFANGVNQWINGGPRGAATAVHELGHNLGYGHANYWRASTGNGLLGHTNGSGGTLEHHEYGDAFDRMGSGPGTGDHYSMAAKTRFNWIETNEVINVAASGIYRIRRFDHIDARQPAGTKLTLSVTNVAGDRFWIGYRRAITNASHSLQTNSAYVIWASPDGFSHRVIQTTPLSVPNGTVDQERIDALLPVGQSWTDPGGTVRITTIGAGGSAPTEYLDVAVDLNVLPPAYQLFTTVDRTVIGLTGSYVNESLRSRAAQEDWRSTSGVAISGTRVDSSVNFPDDGWGSRAAVGLTGGNDGNWENFSVQWDGLIQVNRPSKFATRTDDGSRMWFDLNGNAVFDSTGPEFVDNHWGSGQSATLGDVSVTVAPGLYRIRIQYEETVGDNTCELVAGPAEFELFADANFRTNGLTGSYVNASLRAYSPQDDWRTSQTISGRRLDVYPMFMDNALWGSRASVGLTGGSDGDWENYSVQWDGWIRIHVPTHLATLSDDSSRMWVDVNGNGSLSATAPEFINNHWGTGQGDTFGETSAVINPGTYRIRIQYEEASGGNHFALLGDPQETPGPSGYALYFDGINDYLTVPNAGENMPTNEITIEFWQRAHEVRKQSTFCLVPDQLGNRVAAHIPWSDSGVYWDFGNYQGDGRLSYAPAAPVAGVWTHFALVSSRSGSFQRIYRNGLLEASDSTTMTFARYAAALRIGGNPANEFFKGELDDFRIWATARTQPQIQQYMGSNLLTGQLNLWARWRFDEGSGTNVADLSGNGRNATLANGAQWTISTVPPAGTFVPAIVRQPTLMAVCVGGVANFSVLATGPGLTYQWQRRAAGTGTFTNIPNATAASYSTPPTTAADDGAAFRVLITSGSFSVTSDAALLSVVAVTSPVAMFTFSNGSLGGGSVFGAASIFNNALSLTPTAPETSGAFLLPNLAPGQRVRGFTAAFKAQVISGNGFADGFSFNWATDLPSGVYPQAEEGEGSGLRICFDTYWNADESGVAIEAKWGDTLVGRFETDNNFLPGSANDFAEVAVRLHPDGTLDLNYRCVPIFVRLPVPGYTSLVNARFGLGARTGGTFSRHSIDDLAIELDALVPVVDVSVPGDATVGTSTNSVAFSRPPKAIDNDVTSKYLNFDKLNTGLTITPLGNRPVRALTLISAEDAPERDPSSFVIEGSNNGTNFTRIASNAVPLFAARNTIQTFPLTNTNAFNHYRVVFPTLANAAAANSMQIAEVELLQFEEITATNDTVSIALPPGAADVRGVASLFDRQLAAVRKLEVAPITNADTIVNLTLAAGARVLKGFELIGAADDFTFPQRRPSRVSIAASADGVNFTNLATVFPEAPFSNLQIQEFSTSSNTTAFAHYRITFGPPVQGDRIQLGEMRLFGEAAPLPPPTLFIRASSNNILLSWPNKPGYLLESRTNLGPASWSAVSIAPTLNNGTNTVTLPIVEPQSFFRLRE